MAFPVGWGRKCKITIPGAQISGSHSNFPVLLTGLNLPAEMLDGGLNSALNGGGDVRFSEDSAGAIQLACEVITFATGTTPKAELWVKLPVLASGAAKDFYVWYKKSAEIQPAFTALYGRNAVWSDYEFRARLNSATIILDSTGKYSGMTIVGTPVLTSDGDGLIFDGISDRIDLGFNTHFAQTTAQATISSGTLPTALAGGGRGPLYQDSFAIGWDHASSAFQGAASGLFSGSWASAKFNITPIDLNKKISLTATYDGSNLRAYKNAINESTNSIAGSIISGGENWVVASHPGVLSNFWDGTVYEIRIRNGALSSGWIITEENNQFNSTVFATSGTPVDVGGGASASLAVNGGLSLHTAVNIILTQKHVINITGAKHSHSAMNTTLLQSQALSGTNSSHSFGSYSPLLSQGVNMVTSNATHGVTSDDITIFQLQILAIQNATHGLGGKEAGLFIPTAFTANPHRTNDAMGTGRILSPASGDRTTQPNDNRTLRI